MENVLLTKDVLSSGVELPCDVAKVLAFIASWKVDLELALWYDSTFVSIFQVQYGAWEFLEIEMFRNDLVSAGIAVDYCCVLLCSEVIPGTSDHVATLVIRRHYLQ